jgi:hypothetical protein
MIQFLAATIFWILFIPIGIGIIVFNLTRDRIRGILVALLTVIACSEPFWADALYDWLGPARETLRQKVYIYGTLNFILFVVILSFIPILFMKGKREHLRKLKLMLRNIIFGVAGTSLVFIYSIYASAKAENRLGWILSWGDEIFIKKTRAVSDLVTTILAGSGEGLEILLLFVLSWISVYIVYFPMKTKIFKRVLAITTIWFVIIFINEMVMQSLWFSGREISMHDIFKGMIGILGGAVLSSLLSRLS